MNVAFILAPPPTPIGGQRRVLYWIVLGQNFIDLPWLVWLPWLECCPVNLEVTEVIPRRGTLVLLSHIDISFSLSLPSPPSKVSKHVLRR